MDERTGVSQRQRLGSASPGVADVTPAPHLAIKGLSSAVVGVAPHTKTGSGCGTAYVADSRKDAEDVWLPVLAVLQRLVSVA